MRGTCQARDLGDVQCYLWSISRGSTGKLCSFQPDPLALLPPCSFCWVPGIPGLGCGSRSISVSSRVVLLCAVWMYHSKGAAHCVALSPKSQAGTEQFSQGIQLTHCCLIAGSSHHLSRAVHQQWLWVLVGPWLRPSLPKLTLPPGCSFLGAGGLV